MREIDPRTNLRGTFPGLRNATARCAEHQAVLQGRVAACGATRIDTRTLPPASSRMGQIEIPAIGPRELQLAVVGTFCADALVASARRNTQIQFSLILWNKRSSDVF